MASRKERKEELRREREERARRAQEAERRRRVLGYAAGGRAAVVATVVVVIVVVSAGGGPAEAGGLPEGGSVPEQRIADLGEAARAARCELRSFPGEPPEHTDDLSERIDYNSNPPTNGRHYAEPAEDGAYSEAPDPKQAVHALEHGRVVIWFSPRATEAVKANLKALFDDDSYQLVLTPNTTGMPYQVAASAWNGDPPPNGTGRLLGCERLNDAAFDALRAFHTEHRSKGLEPVP